MKSTDIELRDLLKTGKKEFIDINNLKKLKSIIFFLNDEDRVVRRNTKEILLSAPIIPVSEIVDFYLSVNSEYIADFILENLNIFLVELVNRFNSKVDSILISELIKKIPVKDLFATLVEIAEITPVSAKKAELIIRTCHPSFSESMNSLISYDYIENFKKEVKKLLSIRLKENDKNITTLVLKTVCFFPELPPLIEKELIDIINHSDVEEHIIYATTALINVDNKKNAQILANRLKYEKDSEKVKLAIIESLGNLGNPKIAPIMIELFDEGGQIAYSISKSLGSMGVEVLPYLVQALKEDKYIPNIVEAMKCVGSASFEYLMTSLEKERNIQIRKNIAHCLTLVMHEQYGYEGTIKLLTNELAGKNRELVDAVTQALINLGTPSIEYLIDELNDKDRELRKNAVKILEHFGEGTIEIALDGLLETDEDRVGTLSVILYIYHPDERLRKLGYSFAIHKGNLRAKKDDKLLMILTDALNEIDPYIRIRSCDMLVYFKSKAIPHLTKLLSDPNVLVKRKAAEALRTIKSKRALIALMNAATDKDPIVSEISTRALGELGDPGVVDIILANLKRNSQTIYEASVYALSQLGTPILNKITKELSSSNKKVVDGIVDAVSKIGVVGLEILIKKYLEENGRRVAQIERIIGKMGETAIPELLKIYERTNDSQNKEKLLRLRAKIKDTSVAKEIVEKMQKTSSKKIAIELINLIGVECAHKLVDELLKLEQNKVKRVFTKNIKIEPNILVSIIKEFKLREQQQLALHLINQNQKALKKFVSENPEFESLFEE